MVRLAKEQGLLSQKEITPFQYFALTYSLAMDRRQKFSDDDDFIKQLAAVMDPIRFRQVYLGEDFSKSNDKFEEKPGFEVDPSDFDSIDRYLNSLDKTRTRQA